MHRPDDVDMRIIKELGSPNSPQWNVRESYAKIAERVGADEETIRKRILRLRKSGVLPQWWMKPNPSLMGRQLAEVYTEVDAERKPEAIAAVTRLGGAIAIKNFLGAGMAVSVFYTDESDLGRAIQRIVSATGTGEPVVVREPIPPAEVSMRKIDWKIIHVMADDARIDLQDVADRTGATLRTVQRRLAILMAGRAVFLSGRPEYRDTAGLFCDYLLYCPDPARKEAADGEVLARVRGMVFSLTTSKEYSTFVFSCANPREADETLAFLKGLDGVRRVRMGIMKELIHVQGWLKEELEKRAGS